MSFIVKFIQLYSSAETVKKATVLCGIFIMLKITILTMFMEIQEWQKFFGGIFTPISKKTSQKAKKSRKKDQVADRLNGQWEQWAMGTMTDWHDDQ